jgi:DNA-binding transcriptional MerR regulator/effector-binding domain-containing protein
MRNPNLLRIGEFAQLGHVSIATLHHYDEYGLLKPLVIDPRTGYRYYSISQLLRLNRILVLKELALPLDEIALLLQADISYHQFRTILEAKQREVKQVIEAEKVRLRQLTLWLQHLEGKEAMLAYDILIKPVEPLLVASIRNRISHMYERGPLFTTVEAYVRKHGMQGPMDEIVLLHSHHEIHDELMSIEMEVAIPLENVLPSNEPIRVHFLPTEMVAYTVHSGDDISLGRAYLALQQWISTHGYTVVDAVRQIRFYQATVGEITLPITEIQFPIKKQPPCEISTGL